MIKSTTLSFLVHAKFFIVFRTCLETLVGQTKSTDLNLVILFKSIDQSNYVSVGLA